MFTEFDMDHQEGPKVSIMTKNLNLSISLLIQMCQFKH